MDDPWQTTPGFTSSSSTGSTGLIINSGFDVSNTPDERHPGLYFEDGNIAVRSSSGSYFIVHKGVILRHCSFFQDPVIPLDESARIESKPVLKLGDSAEDLLHFLTALYDGISSVKCNAHDFHIASAVLRLATKYGANHLRSSLLDQLSFGWPSTLQQWELRERMATSPTGMYAPRPMYPHPILVIQLAREVDAPQLLPSAFYDLSRYMPSQMILGCMTSDKTHHRLSNDEMLQTLKGKESAARFLSTFIVTELEGRDSCDRCFYRYPGVSFEKSKTCRIAFEAITFEILRDVHGLVCNRNSDPLYAIAETIGIQIRSDLPDEERIIGHRACEACRIVLAASVDSARESFWMNLPDWFSIGVTEWGGH